MMIGRRSFLAGAASSVAFTTAANAQGPLPKLAYVSSSLAVEQLTATGGVAAHEGFHRELKRLGYVDGDTITIEYWSGAGRDGDGYASFARDIVASNPDVIRTNTYRIVSALKASTNRIPVVFVATDPIGNGLVSNLARPGGNLTGFAAGAGVSFESKRLEALARMAPSARRFAYLAPESVWLEDPLADAARRGAGDLGVEMLAGVLDDPIGPASYENTFADMSAAGVEGVVTSNVSENYFHDDVIIRLARETSLPTIYLWRPSVLNGGLVTYSTDFVDVNYRMAGYVARILQGEHPGELPVQQPTKFEFVINTATATELGLTIRPAVLLQATEIIE